MKIEMDIIKNGEQVGTVGWLAQQAHAVKIGVCEDNDPGAFLQDKNGQNIATLCTVEFGPGDGKYGVLRGDYGHRIPLTRAASASLERLAERVAQVLNREQESEEIVDLIPVIQKRGVA